jgi:hypothetical protein
MRAVGRSRTAAEVAAILDDPLGRLPRDARLPGGDTAVDPRLVSQSPDAATVTVSGSGAAVVGLRRAFQVGWAARQDDADLAVLRVGGQSLAAVVPEVSRGPILFTYRLPAFNAGLAISGLSLVALLLLCFARLPRTGRSGAPLPPAARAP